MTENFWLFWGPDDAERRSSDIMSGLEEQTEGQIIYNGKEWKGLNPEIGMVFQKLALMPFKTVIENVELALKFRGMGKRKKKRNRKTLYRAGRSERI